MTNDDGSEYIIPVLLTDCVSLHLHVQIFPVSINRNKNLTLSLSLYRRESNCARSKGVLCPNIQITQYSQCITWTHFNAQNTALNTASSWAPINRRRIKYYLYFNHILIENENLSKEPGACILTTGSFDRPFDSTPIRREWIFRARWDMSLDSWTGSKFMHSLISNEKPCLSETELTTISMNRYQSLEFSLTGQHRSHNFRNGKLTLVIYAKWNLIW